MIAVKFGVNDTVFYVELKIASNLDEDVENEYWVICNLHILSYSGYATAKGGLLWLLKPPNLNRLSPVYDPVWM